MNEHARKVLNLLEFIMECEPDTSVDELVRTVGGRHGDDEIASDEELAELLQACANRVTQAQTERWNNER